MGLKLLLNSSVTFFYVFVLGCSIVKHEPHQDGKAVVLLLGTFHFANPQKDLIKTPVHNVLNSESQRYLEDLSARLSQFKPTAILLEYDVTSDTPVNTLYSKYCENKYDLSASEVDQLGFRIAKSSGLNRVDSFDDRAIPWEAGPLFQQLKLEPHIERRFQSALRMITDQEIENQSKLPLRDLLKRLNSPEADQLNKGLYIITHVAGVDRNFEGAQASASWWHRNFRMLARIQKFAKPGERLIVVGGQGHIAIIRDLIKLDPEIFSEEIDDYL